MNVAKPSPLRSLVAQNQHSAADRDAAAVPGPDTFVNGLGAQLARLELRVLL